MSWKPCRGGHVLLDKAVNDSHEYYFKFHEETDFKNKCKAAFKWMKAEKYLRGRYTFEMLGNNFLNEIKTNKNTYKPLINLIQNEHHTNRAI